VRYLDEPFALERAQLQEVRERLKILADPHKTPLPSRLRATFVRMVVRLDEIEREIQQRPDQLTLQRGEEDRHGEPG
jgi:hypothetical protein